MGLGLKETLKHLCCSNGWCYGIFWRFDERNSMLLTVEDAFYEEQMGAVVNKMIHQVHVLGEGVVGQVASTGNHQWILSDADGSVGGQHMFQTIAVMSVEARGVIELGSTKKILEGRELLDQAKKLFSEMENVNGLTLKDSPSSSLDCESYDLNEWFDSLCNGNITPIDGGTHNELVDIAYALPNAHFLSLTSDVRQERMSTSHMESSHCTNHLQTASYEPQGTFSSNPKTQVSSQYAPSLMKSATEIPCISTWSNEGSILTSLKSQFQPEMGVHDSPNASFMKVNTPLSCKNADIFQLDSTASLYGTGGLIDVGKLFERSSENLVRKQDSAALLHTSKGGLPEEENSLDKLLGVFKSDDLPTLSNSDGVDNIFGWLSPSPERLCGMATVLNNYIPQSKGVTSLSSGLIGDVVLDIPFEQPAASVQSCITDAYACSGNQKSLVGNDPEKDLFEGLGVSFVQGQAGNCWEDAMTPAGSTSNMAVSSVVSECVPELDPAGSPVAPKKGLFSELGLEELLDGISNSNYAMKSNMDAKRRKVEGSSFSGNQGQLVSQSYSGVCTKMETEYNLDKRNGIIPKTEVFPKSQVSLWIDDSYSVNNDMTIAKLKKPELPVKATKKRARPGESTRPRPKDRQQIQDRLKELREIIPDGGKCSIDALLDSTIKHMLFLQSVTKYADKLKQADEPTLIGQEKRMVQKGNSTSSGGKTWALEVADETMVCPIIVEDLSPPGLMLIEMLCEDRGFFLEIADVIKGFGLNILKGVMETREDKIWARFIVEAKTHTTRIEIFWSLAQLLDRTGTSGLDSMNQPINPLNGGVPLLSNYQLPALPCPISLANTLQ